MPKRGRLTAIKKEGVDKHGQTMWSFLCDCGNIIKARASSVKSGHTNSCGCYGKDQRRKAVITHGLSGHPLYAVWQSMKSRCKNPNDKVYRYYGGRGITACNRWLNSFSAFFNWAINNGWKKGLEIDRKNNDGDYCPENCRITNRRINVQNKRQFLKGKSGFLGVAISKSGNRFRAKYSYKNKIVHLGYFSTAIEAAIVRHRAVVALGESYMLDAKVKKLLAMHENKQ